LINGKLLFSQDLSSVCINGEPKIIKLSSDFEVLFFRITDSTQTCGQLVLSANEKFSENVDTLILSVALKQFIENNRKSINDSSDLHISQKKSFFAFDSKSKNTDTILNFAAEFYRMLFLSDEISEKVQTIKTENLNHLFIPSVYFFGYLHNPENRTENEIDNYSETVFEQKYLGAKKYLILFSTLNFDDIKRKIQDNFGKRGEYQNSKTKNRNKSTQTKPILYYYEKSKSSKIDFSVNYFDEDQTGNKNESKKILIRNYFSDINSLFSSGNKPENYNFEKFQNENQNRLIFSFSATADKKDFRQILLKLTNSDSLKNKIDENGMQKLRDESLKIDIENYSDGYFALSTATEKQHEKLSVDYYSKLSTNLSEISVKQMNNAMQKYFAPENCVIFASGPKESENELYAFTDKFEIRIAKFDNSENEIIPRGFNASSIFEKYKTVCNIPRYGKSVQLKVRGNYTFPDQNQETFEIINRKGKNYESAFYICPDTISKILIQKIIFNGKRIIRENTADTVSFFYNDTISQSVFGPFYEGGENYFKPKSSEILGLFNDKGTEVYRIKSELSGGITRISVFERDSGFKTEIIDFDKNSSPDIPFRTVEIGDYRKPEKSNQYFPYHKKTVCHEFSADFEITDISVD
jgi:hypothetical protein